jgi:SpoIID/LytB domain protein
MPVPPCRLPLVLLPRLLLAGCLLLPGGCRAASQPEGAEAVRDQAAAAPALQWPVPPPPRIEASEPVLWVALADHLGPKPEPAAGSATAATPAGRDGAGAMPLRLRGAAGPLTLIDARGQRFTGDEFTLQWRRQALPQPLLLRRRVIGPFASFESAEEAAGRWRTAGVKAEIAHPGEWEVWAPAEAAPPEGAPARLVERQETHRLTLELRRPAGVVALEGPIRIEAPKGLRWREGTYAGPFRLQGNAYGGWSLVEQVPLERYLEGVVPHEIGAGSPPAALEAQAVLARTWALRNSHRFAVDGYHLCADTQCQVYSDPRQAGAAVRKAIAASRHQVLSWQGQPIHAVYHASNGGVAAGFEEVWNGAALPYLRPFADGPVPFQGRFGIPLAPAALPLLLRDGGQAWGSTHPLFRWQRLLTAAQIGKALSAAAVEGGAEVGVPRRLEVVERGPSGRVMGLEITGSTGKKVLRLDAIRRTLRQLPSTLFTVAPSGNGAWLVVGGGFGHGAGLSQAGAIDLARQGWSTSRILEHYYPGTDLGSLRDLGEAP